MNHHGERRGAALAIVAVGALAGGVMLAGGAESAAWPQPELLPEPPYVLFVAVVGVGALVLGGAAWAGRPPLRRWEYGLLLLVGGLATWFSTSLHAEAQQCCETSWILGYGYPLDFLHGGVAPPERVSREAAENLVTADEIDPVTGTLDVVFWAFAASLAYVPARLAAHRRSTVPLGAHRPG